MLKLPYLLNSFNYKQASLNHKFRLIFPFLCSQKTIPCQRLQAFDIISNRNTFKVKINKDGYMKIIKTILSSLFSRKKIGRLNSSLLSLLTAITATSTFAAEKELLLQDNTPLYDEQIFIFSPSRSYVLFENPAEAPAPNPHSFSTINEYLSAIHTELHQLPKNYLSHPAATKAMRIINNAISKILAANLTDPTFATYMDKYSLNSSSLKGSLIRTLVEDGLSKIFIKLSMVSEVLNKNNFSPERIALLTSLADVCKNEAIFLASLPQLLKKHALEEAARTAQERKNITSHIKSLHHTITTHQKTSTPKENVKNVEKWMTKITEFLALKDLLDEERSLLIALKNYLEDTYVYRYAEYPEYYGYWDLK